MNDEDPFYEVTLAFMKAANIAMIILIVFSFGLLQVLESTQ